MLSNSAPLINGKQRYAVNRASYFNPDTPLKLADYFNISGVFSTDTIQSQPADGSAFLATSVLRSALHDFLEIVFQNNENEVQSWHLDGYDIWVVGYVFQVAVYIYLIKSKMWKLDLARNEVVTL